MDLAPPNWRQIHDMSRSEAGGGVRCTCCGAVAMRGRDADRARLWDAAARSGSVVQLSVRRRLGQGIECWHLQFFFF